jgi:hypothetical protein
MHEPAKKPFAGATPAKLALIAALAIVLIGVLLVQFGAFGGGAPRTASSTKPKPAAKPAPSSEVSEPAPKGSAAAATTRAGSATKKSPMASTPASRVAARPVRPWAPPKVEEIARYDPFDVPPPMVMLFGSNSTGRSPAAGGTSSADRDRTLHETLAALRDRGVTMILTDAEGPLAVVGDRTVRIGDRVGGFVVTDISLEEGIVLEIAPELP